VGVRSLAKTPAFTVLAVSSLALGIMTTTAIYSVLYAIVLDPFPYKNVDDLTSVLVREPSAARDAPHLLRTIGNIRAVSWIAS
jgi:hypothetical protein